MACSMGPREPMDNASSDHVHPQAGEDGCVFEDCLEHLPKVEVPLYLAPCVDPVLPTDVVLIEAPFTFVEAPAAPLLVRRKQRRKSAKRLTYPKVLTANEEVMPHGVSDAQGLSEVLSNPGNGATYVCQHSLSVSPARRDVHRGLGSVPAVAPLVVASDLSQQDGFPRFAAFLRGRRAATLRWCFRGWRFWRAARWLGGGGRLLQCLKSEAWS